MNMSAMQLPLWVASSVRLAASAQEGSATHAAHHHVDHLQSDGRFPWSPCRGVVIRFLDGQGREIDLAEVWHVNRGAETLPGIGACNSLDQRAFDRSGFACGGSSTAGKPGPIKCSLIKTVAGAYPGQGFGTAIDVPNFGKIYLATLTVEESDYDTPTGLQGKRPSL